MRFLTIIFWLFANTLALGQAAPIKACFTQWYPYTYIKNKNPAGLSIEIYSAIIKKAQMEISYEFRPWKRCMVEFAQGNFDALVDGDYLIPNSFNTKQSPVPWVLLFWVHQDSSHQKYVGYSQFDNQYIGYIRGYIDYQSRLREYRRWRHRPSGRGRRHR